MFASSSALLCCCARQAQWCLWEGQLEGGVGSEAGSRALQLRGEPNSFPEASLPWVPVSKTKLLFLRAHSGGLPQIWIEGKAISYPLLHPPQVKKKERKKKQPSVLRYSCSGCSLIGLRSVWGAQTNQGWMGLSEGSDLPADITGLMATGTSKAQGQVDFWATRVGSGWRCLLLPFAVTSSDPLAALHPCCHMGSAHSLSSLSFVGKRWENSGISCSGFTVVPDPQLLSKVPATAQRWVWEVFPLARRLEEGLSARLQARSVLWMEQGASLLLWWRPTQRYHLSLVK